MIKGVVHSSNRGVRGCNRGSLFVPDGWHSDRALSVYRLTSDAPKETWLTSNRDTRIYNWNKAIQVLAEINQLGLPEMFKQRNDVLTQYCNLRISSYNYLAQKIAGTASPGEDSVLVYNAQITELLNSLKNAK